MSCAVMLSVRPAWCELIASGKKTIEVRKTRPKLATPFKVYIYETRGASDTPIVDEDGHMDFHGRGKVIGEFSCDFIYHNIPYDSSQTCVPACQLREYANGKPIYGWHISALQIYDRPKELGEFYRICPSYHANFGICWECDNAVGEECDCGVNGEIHLTRPPQSWGYVEELHGT